MGGGVRMRDEEKRIDGDAQTKCNVAENGLET